MRRLMLVSMLVGTAPLAAQQPGQRPSGWQGPDIITSATGEARVTPDRAQIFVGVQTRAATAAQAGADNARKTRAVIDAVKGRGIPAEQIGTSEYNLFPEYDHREQPRGVPQTPRVIGYVANNTVRVEVRRLDQVGAIIDAALAASARGDAEALAKAAGGSLGPLVELNTQSPPVRPLYRERVAMLQSSGADVQTPIEPGQQTLTVWVSGRWLLAR